MCLNTVDKVTKEGSGTGYKLMWVTPDNQIISFFKNKKKWELNKWSTSRKTKTIEAEDGQEYVPHFHIYIEMLHLPSRYKRFNYKVSYRDVTASGIEGSKEVIVARKCRIDEVGS